MTDVFKIFFIAMLTNNIVLTGFLGICSYLGVSKSTKSSIGMGFALTFVVMMSAIISYFFDNLLVAFHIEYMRTVVFILIIASLVQFVEMFIKKFSPSLYKSLGIFLPLITTNCVVLYVAKNIVNMGDLLNQFGLVNAWGGLGDFIFMLVYSLGTALGFFFVIVIFANIRERMDHAPVVKGFKGVAIALICTAIMAMAFMGLNGIF